MSGRQRCGAPEKGTLVEETRKRKRLRLSAPADNIDRRSMKKMARYFMSCTIKQPTIAQLDVLDTVESLTCLIAFAKFFSKGVFAKISSPDLFWQREQHEDIGLLCSEQSAELGLGLG